MIEGSFLLMNGLNIIRFWRMQRRGIDPFKVEKTPSAVDEKGLSISYAGRYLPRRSSSAWQAAAVNSTSVDEFSAVSRGVLQYADNKADSNHLHGDIVRNTEHITGQWDQQQRPPAAPDAPQAHREATTLSSSAVGRSTGIPSVLTAASVNTVMVIAAPAILMVAPSGIETE